MREMHPWPNEPLWCGIEWVTPEKGYLYYDFPLPDGSTQRHSLPIAPTRSIADVRSRPKNEGGPVWHFHDNGDGTGWTEPSIYCPGFFHSPYHTKWRVDHIPEGQYTWEPPEETDR